MGTFGVYGVLEHTSTARHDTLPNHTQVNARHTTHQDVRCTVGPPYAGASLVQDNFRTLPRTPTPHSTGVSHLHPGALCPVLCMRHHKIEQHHPTSSRLWQRCSSSRPCLTTAFPLCLSSLLPSLLLSLSPSPTLILSFFFFLCALDLLAHSCLSAYPTSPYHARSGSCLLSLHHRRFFGPQYSLPPPITSSTTLRTYTSAVLYSTHATCCL